MRVLFSYYGYLDRRIMIHFFEEFEKLIWDYEIERENICIIGSSVLTEEGFRENHDFDFAITVEARTELLSKYEDKLNVLPSGTICFNKDVQILQNRYGELGIDDNMLFAKEYSIPYGKGLRIARFELEIAKKITRFVAKDETDLNAISNSEKLELIDWKQVLNLVCNRRNLSNSKGFCNQMKSIVKSCLRRCKRNYKNLFINNKKTKEYIESYKQRFFCAILWGTVVQYFDVIEADIAKHHRIVKSSTIDHLSNIEQFVYDIYSIDNIDKWKIKLKQAYLSEITPSIRVVLFEINNPNFRVSERTGEFLSDEGAKLKNKIRNKYNKKLDKYIYDVIIHTSDNYDISLKMVEVIKSYGIISDV